MTNLVETPNWEAGIYQLETNDPCMGGLDGIDNVPPRQLANRTAWLKQQQEAHAAAADPHPQYMTASESTAAINAAVAALVNSSPTALDTLAELATALGNDPNYATTITNALAGKAPWTVLEQIITAAGITVDHNAPDQTLMAIRSLIANNGTTKYPVRAATTANIANLAGGAPSTLDGVALAANDRVLVKDQTTGSQNGIYVVTTLGTGANGTWTRATDADDAGELISGMLVAVNEGATYPDTLWELATDGAIVIGTTALTFKWAGGLVGLTQAQFDNSTKLVTSAFVQRALGNYADVAAYTATGNIAASDAGKLVQVSNAGAITLTLPALASVPYGAAYTFINTNAGTVTLAGNGAELINYGAPSFANIAIPSNQMLVVAKFGATWAVILSDAGLSKSPLFGSSLAANGYQKLPSGLIVQWGSVTVTSGTPVAVTFPIAFPTAAPKIIPGSVTPAAAGNVPYVNSLTTTGFSANFSGSGSNSFHWIAFGY